LTASAIVKYDEGRLEVNGIQLLQDNENLNSYYYIPPYPRISRLNNGDFEFFCIKYVGTKGKEDSGGLLHTLVQFSLAPDELVALQAALTELLPGAVVMGPVPMMEDDEEGSPPGFSIVSSILSQSGSNQFTTDVITSGKAPLVSGSKAAIAARLTPEGSTLLWESFSGPTSDISVVIQGYYRALVKGYHAVISADLEVVYDHFSSFQNKQGGFKRRQTREAIDSLAQTGIIDIQIADMSDAYDVNSSQYADLLNIVTEKIVDLIFNVKTGWAKMPVTESGIRPDEIKERYEHGAFVSFFVGNGTQPYIPDDQLLLKTKQEIRNFRFSLNLTQSTAIKVPIYSAGNVGGFYDAFKDDERYFRVVDMNDPSFQIRQVFFQLDGNFVDSFDEVLDHVSVRIQKRYANPDHNAFAGTLIFNKESISQGKFIQSVEYKRLGDPSDHWLAYDYQVAWKLLGIDSTFMQPDSAWRTSGAPSISLQPPFAKQEIEIDLDREGFEAYGYQSARIRFGSILGGKPFKGKAIILRKSDVLESVRTNIYHDPDQAIVYQVSWYGANNKTEDPMRVLEEDYLFLIPPPAQN
jgi:hypothetical protein